VVCAVTVVVFGFVLWRQGRVSLEFDDRAAATALLDRIFVGPSSKLAAIADQLFGPEIVLNGRRTVVAELPRPGEGRPHGGLLGVVVVQVDEPVLKIGGMAATFCVSGQKGGKPVQWPGTCTVATKGGSLYACDVFIKHDWFPDQVSLDACIGPPPADTVEAPMAVVVNGSYFGHAVLTIKRLKWEMQPAADQSKLANVRAVPFLPRQLAPGGSFARAFELPTFLEAVRSSSGRLIRARVALIDQKGREHWSDPFVVDLDALDPPTEVSPEREAQQGH
jgi:hypothetical protein